MSVRDRTEFVNQIWHWIDSSAKPKWLLAVTAGTPERKGWLLLRRSDSSKPQCVRLSEKRPQVRTLAAFCSWSSSILQELRNIQRPFLTSCFFCKLKEAGGKEQYRVEISERFAALENLDAQMDINRTGETYREYQISAKERRDYSALKKHKPCFDEGFSKL